MEKPIFDKPLMAALFAAMLVSATMQSAAAPADAGAEKPLRFEITGYVIEGAALVKKEEIAAAVAPFTGPNKDFSDVQYAIEAIEALYAAKGFSSVRVILPEQELQKGSIRFRVVESWFGKVTVEGNKFVTEANVLAALPSVRSGQTPRTKQIARELKLANENPARQINAVLKAGKVDEEVDARLVVTDSKPVAWGVTFDNTGAPETGETRLGFSVRHANLFDADHVATLQYLMSPERSDRVHVLGGSYKIPLYARGDSVQFFAGYSNVNSVVGGLSNFQGGGLLFSARYNLMLEKALGFDQSVSLGADWRDFKRIEQTTPAPLTLFNEVVVTPLSATYSAQGKFERSDISGTVSLSVNVPEAHKGKAADFAAYDPSGALMPDPNFRVVRYAASYATLIGEDTQFRSALTGQWTDNSLVLGEQMRLGGADAVRGFSEGSENGNSGIRINLELYSPDFGGKLSKTGNVKARAVAFLDWGTVEASNDVKSSISGAGVGLRFGISDQLAIRLDVAQIINDGNDPQQRAGKTRVHFSLSASF